MSNQEVRSIEQAKCWAGIRTKLAFLVKASSSAVKSKIAIDYQIKTTAIIIMANTAPAEFLFYIGYLDSLFYDINIGLRTMIR